MAKEDKNAQVGQNVDDQGDRQSALDLEKAARDQNMQQFVLGEGVHSSVEDKLEYGYMGYAPDGPGINDANRDDNSYGGNAVTEDPNVSTQQDAGKVGK